MKLLKFLLAFSFLLSVPVYADVGQQGGDDTVQSPSQDDARDDAIQTNKLFARHVQKLLNVVTNNSDYRSAIPTVQKLKRLSSNLLDSMQSWDSDSDTQQVSSKFNALQRQIETTSRFLERLYDSHPNRDVRFHLDRIQSDFRSLRSDVQIFIRTSGLDTQD